jgi:hypothetical protein
LQQRAARQRLASLVIAAFVAPRGRDVEEFLRMGLMTLLAVLGFGVTVARLGRMSQATALFHAAAVIVLILYLGALAGVLWWVSLTIHLVGAAMLGNEALRAARTGNKASVPVPIGILLLVACLFWFVHGGRQYYMYDEYSHWGIFLKEMLALDGFWLADTNSMHPRYPPAATLWQYLFSALGVPTEGKAYLAQFVLLVIPLLVLWDRLVWRQVAWIASISALCVLVLANYGLGVVNLYVDPVISTWFAGVLLSNIADSDQSWLRRALLSAAPIAVIALLKDGALGFALAASGTVALLLFVSKWRESRRFDIAMRRGFLSLLLMGGAAVFSVQVWTWNRDIAGSSEEVASFEGIVQGIRAGAPEAAEREAELARRFSDVVQTQQLSNDAVTWQFNEFTYGIRSLFVEPFRLTTLAAFILFTVWSAALVVIVMRGSERWVWSTAAIGVLLTAAAYLFVLYLSYPFVFGERGLELPSYVRYANTVVLPMVLFALAPLVPAFAGRDRHPGLPDSRLKTGFFMTGLLALWIFEFPYLRPIVAGHPKSELRQELEPVAAALHEALGRDALWIYLPQDSGNGFVGRLLQYLLSPTPATVERSMSYFERDSATLAAGFQRFSYVWIPTALPPEVSSRVSAMSHGVTQGLFLVTGDGRELVPVTDSSEVEREMLSEEPARNINELR